ncbi:IclR family transcriptional regulator [Sulfitobacter dubius]|uniref:Pca regulon regulatory protein n=1 Tax=Sulfitobacter dubius TaxID=218673 RepID=A0ABY3ZSX8_9RHOB|nr:IclR family transcriptional regulator [Sulfitobacter dubius]UOA17205.1 Pca regulon regulatory protein [Sulfitobacter dubius]
MARARTSEAEIVSLERGLRILRAFQSSDTPLGNKEIVERAGLSKATVARLCHTLLEMGYLRQIGSQGKYHLDDNVTVLGHAFLRSLTMRRIAEPMLQEVANRHEMSVALGIGNGPHMIYLVYCAGARTVTMRLRVGTLLPIHETAMGRAWMSALQPAQCDRHMAEIRALTGGDADVVETALRREMEKTRQSGFSVSFGDWRKEIFGVGVPLWLDGGRTIAAMNCGARRRGQDPAYFSDVLGPEMMLLSSELSDRIAQLGANFWDE